MLSGEYILRFVHAEAFRFDCRLKRKPVRHLAYLLKDVLHLFRISKELTHLAVQLDLDNTSVVALFRLDACFEVMDNNGGYSPVLEWKSPHL